MKIISLLTGVLFLFLAGQAYGGGFVDNGDSTVTDSITGFMWQQTEGGAMTWEQALTYCEELPLAGHVDWRLPNIKELESITDNRIAYFDPATDTTAFPDALSRNYWSSTTSVSNTSLAWYVSFFNGGADDYSKSSSYDVRCVR